MELRRARGGRIAPGRLRERTLPSTSVGRRRSLRQAISAAESATTPVGDLARRQLDSHMSACHRRRRKATTNTMHEQRHRLDVDHAEHNARLLELARQSGTFEVQMVRLESGDYLINNGVLIERKTCSDFATSLADGRLFPQAAKLTHSPHRPVVLIEGPTPARVPKVDPHAVQGAILSLAVMWRLPVLHSRDPEDSLRILQLLANQALRSEQLILRRYDRKPKRINSRRLYVLQGLPGVGPALAHRLLLHFGSVERVVTADDAALSQVRGLGPRKAALIRDVLR